MVHTWNREPSTSQSSAGLDTDLNVRERVKSPSLSTSPRFVRDANSTVPNFLNGMDGQKHELNAVYRPVNTNTHTRYSDERLFASKSEAILGDRFARSAHNSSFMSQRPASPSARSMVCNDTRYDALRDPYDRPLDWDMPADGSVGQASMVWDKHPCHAYQGHGPGDYDVALAQPIGVGPLPLTSMSNLSSPARDALRMSAAFVSPQRKESYPFLGGGADQVYVSPLSPQMAADHLVPFDRQTKPFRTSAADWRFGSRIKDLRRGMSQADYSDYKTDVAGRLLDVSKSADGPNTSGWAFASRSPRLVTLPRNGCNDVRLARGRVVEDVSHLGPGTYGPPICDNGKPKPKRTYRLHIPPAQADAAMSASFTRAMARYHADTGVCFGSSAKLPGSSSFQSVNRQAKFGPFSWGTDSTLTRTI